ncbi:acylphosphatase [Plectonema cf. radiosum LEGE 06105]|uniref:acylphosphatase n=1 Tax=Plectonema cf. radiosum LEGE 06105 TaxID=945769 RepID=A0A8J7F8V0_9CYAN|nr:acylphosphatase [Plectonema radiosum]MBE9216410.1 acylphosphatase [Plectonema cf. radiosum LEGE 06105]
MSNSTLPKQTRAHALISGKVQGVGYRYSTMNAAKKLGLNGWVRNLPDSRVEAVFEGASEVVQEMIRWCHDGSIKAIVTDVQVKYSEAEGLQGFEIIRSHE